ncbi:MAG: CpaF family protein [Lachnospiraceae bacterium]|nr:CpaF family protein [Lachnospiraceae bacterium]
MNELGVKERLKERVLADIDMSRTLEDDEIGRVIDKCILEESKNMYLPLKEKVQLRVELFNTFRRLDVLTELLEDESISEVMVNGFDSIFVEKKGKIMPSEKTFDSEDKLKSVIQQIVADCNRRINEANPIVDARLRDGSRVNIVMNPVALSGPTVTIRKFPNMSIDMNRLIELGSIDSFVSKILELLVEAKYNIFISGGTGSGKTTFLNVLSNFIPKDERIITIEDSAELKIQGVENLVRLEARNANLEGDNSITIRDLIKTSLRMRPDRIIVGEVRDEAAIDMLQAMNTGHDGSLSTGHANSAEDMLSRLETMVLMGMDIPLAAIRKQIASAVDIIVHLGRLRDKTRKVIKICEVVGMENGEIKLNTLYEFSELGEKDGRIVGKLRKINDLLNVQKLMNFGLFNMYKEAQDEIQYT